MCMFLRNVALKHSSIQCLVSVSLKNCQKEGCFLKTFEIEERERVNRPKSFQPSYLKFEIQLPFFFSDKATN